MRLVRPFREWSLGAKLATTFLVVVAGVATLVGVAVIRHERAALDTELRKRGVNLAEHLGRISRDLVLQDDLWGLYKVVRDTTSGAGDGENIVVYATVLDPAGTVLAHSDPARHPMGEPIGGEVGLAVGPSAGTRVQTVTREDETIHDVATPIVVDKQRIGVARVGITTRHLEATVARLTRDVLVLTSVLGGLGVILGLLVSRRMTRPLRELGRAVDRLGEGHLDEPVSVATVEQDEIGRLAERFNRMAQRLRDTVGEIAATKQYLENLLEHANDFIYTLDLEGRITYLNHQFLELGLRKEDLLGEPLDVLVRRPELTASDRVLPPLPRQMFEVQVMGRDGRSRTLVVTESPLVDDDLRRIGTLGIAKDVTELTELQGRLIRSERLASVGELAGALAHEIRNPLGSLFAAAKMLAAESPQAAGYDRHALLQVIGDESRRLERTLTDFLAFARPRPPVRRLHHLNGLIGEVLDAVRLDAVAKGKTMATHLASDLPPVPVDGDQVKQVVWNVVRNALEATPPGGRLEVSTQAVNGRVVIEVADGGAGIPPERQARLFEPFQTTKPGGSGLGLAIAHRIVTAHDGTIDVDSQPGVGTRVRVDLPRETTRVTGPSGSLLIVDDEASMRLTLGMLLRGEGWTVREAAGVVSAVALLEQEPFDVVITDLRMDDAGGIDVLKTAKRVSPETEVVILTAFGSLGSAVEAVKLGAFDYLSKPFEPDELVVVVRKALERRALLREVDQLRAALEAELGVNRIVAKGAAMRRLFDLVRRVAVSDATILIQGESGTGKELIARMVHARSLRASHPFVAVDCGTLPEPLLESELFGHVRGAFTGAVAAKKGLVEEAQGGTVFLDEIDVLALGTQVKLHRVLQERTIRRVGSTASIQVDTRVIVATNRDLAALVRREHFREDLFYRLNGIVLEVPPLRARAEDIIPLAVHFLRTYAERMGKSVTGLAPEAMDRLLQHSWPGNVRELEKAMERAAVLAETDVIGLADLPPALQERDASRPPPLGRRTLADVEKAHILSTLYEVGWNQAQAAEALGIGRTTLWRKLREYGIRPPA